MKAITVELTSGYVFASVDGFIISWSTNERRVLWKIPYQRQILALSGGRNVIMSDSAEKAIRRWDVKSRAPIGDPFFVHGSLVSCVAMRSDEKVIVSVPKTIRYAVGILKAGHRLAVHLWT